MSAKRELADSLLACLAHFCPTEFGTPEDPQSILVLRNNDLGDLLVVTPLFQALKERFPQSRIIAGIGSWSKAILDNNPYVDEILELNAPWHNQVIENQDPLSALNYIYFSAEADRLASSRVDIGIDVVGSHWGALLFLKAGIPYRLGVEGFAGGHKAMGFCVKYNAMEHVGLSALRFAEALGAKQLPANYPQIYLSGEEILGAKKYWQDFAGAPAERLRLIISHGGGFAAKRWPLSSYVELVNYLAAKSWGGKLPAITLLGGPGDVKSGQEFASPANNVNNQIGLFSLRQTFACISQADLVIGNSSMIMHAAAAFRKPYLALLGEYFPSASQHQAQWGYEGLCTSLGKETSAGLSRRESIATVLEVCDLVDEFAQLHK